MCVCVYYFFFGPKKKYRITTQLKTILAMNQQSEMNITFCIEASLSLLQPFVWENGVHSYFGYDTGSWVILKSYK